MCQIARFVQFPATIFINSFADSLRFLQSLTARRTVLAAENLFLRKQLAFYQEHQSRPRRLTAAARFTLLLWVAVLRLAERSSHRQTRNPDRRTAQEVQAVAATRERPQLRVDQHVQRQRAPTVAMMSVLPTRTSLRVSGEFPSALLANLS
jgi:hypothetical protein